MPIQFYYESNRETPNIDSQQCICILILYFNYNILNVNILQYKAIKCVRQGNTLNIIINLNFFFYIKITCTCSCQLDSIRPYFLSDVIDARKFNPSKKPKYICKISIKINPFSKIVLIIYKRVKKDYLKKSISINTL